MYVKSVTISNIRSFTSLTWEIPDEQAAGWHVILGDNGAGKSTFLRCIALALIGPDFGLALRQDWAFWLRQRKSQGYIKLKLLYEQGRNSEFEDEFISHHASDEANNPLLVEVGFRTETGQVRLHDMTPTAKCDPFTHVWGSRKGWFSASYGPFRRFAGGDRDTEERLRSYPTLVRHLTLFGEDIALTETLNWLQGLRFKELEGDPDIPPLI